MVNFLLQNSRKALLGHLVHNVLLPLKEFKEHGNDFRLDFNRVQILLLRDIRTDLNSRPIEYRDRVEVLL